MPASSASVQRSRKGDVVAVCTDDDHDRALSNGKGAGVNGIEIASAYSDGFFQPRAEYVNEFHAWESAPPKGAMGHCCCPADQDHPLPEHARMIQLYYRPYGAREIILEGPAMPIEAWVKLRALAIKLLRQRGNSESASLLESLPFELREGTNGFGDEFAVLYWCAPLEKYVEASEWSDEVTHRNLFGAIASAVSELASQDVRFIAVDLDKSDGPEIVTSPNLAITSAVVERALRDAETLLASSGATSGLDRVHTALHGYLKQLCDANHLPYPADPTVTQLFKVIREQHPAFTGTTPYDEQLRRALNSFSSVVDVLNSMRNNASPAHPTATLLGEHEAMFFINATKTLLHYLNAKTR